MPEAGDPMSDLVLIVGAGIAGLSLSIALAQRGVRSEIVERSPDWRSDGAGLFTCANGLAALDRLGVGPAVRERGVPIRQRRIETARGRSVMVVDERDIWGGDRDSLGISRSALQDALRERLRDPPIHFGTTVDSLGTTPDRVEVVRSDGDERVYTAVVGADGHRSSVRQMVLGAPVPRLVEPRAARWLSRRPAGPDVWTLRADRDGMFLMIPVSEDEVYCYATRRERALELDTDEWLEPFGAFADPVPDVLASRVTEVFEDRVEEIPIPDVWGDGRVMLIGDAAHAMAPFMAQGGSLALEDAEAAAAIIAEGDLDEAALRLTTARAARTEWVQARNRRREKLSELPFTVAKLGLRVAGRRSWIADLAPLAPND